MRALTLTGLTITLAATMACSDSSGPGNGGDPAPQVLLRDVVLSNLPSPYYHFEYGTGGRISRVSFASGFTMYDVIYEGDRIGELRNNTLGNTDRLQYVYDGAGRVEIIVCRDAAGTVFMRFYMTYDGERLIKLERERKVDVGFVLDKTLSFSYHPDGNLSAIEDHRPAIDGQPATTAVDHFDNYDDGINVDGFSLLHPDFFEHLVLLPGVRLQRGNPRRNIRTGDGLNFTVDYTYTYDAAHRPLAKNGTLTITNGPDAGDVVSVSSMFSYY
jgi:hypothetical protein